MTTITQPPPTLHTAARLLIAACNLYGGAILIFLLIRLILGDPVYLIELGSNLMPVILLPSLVPLTLMLILRRWTAALLHLVPVAALIIGYGGYFIPREREAPANVPVITVLTHNLESQAGEMSAEIAIIKQADADIVALQELTLIAQDQLAPALLELGYTHQLLFGDNAYAMGAGIFSRLPIIDSLNWRDGAFNSQRAVIRLPNEATFVLYNAHPPPPRWFPIFDSSRRRIEALSWARLLAVETQPYLLVGDFNMTDQTGDYAEVTRHAGDTFRAVGLGLGATFPNFEHWTVTEGLGLPLPPIIRIDYVFHSAEWIPLEAHVIPNSGMSDHYPLWARLAFGG